MPCYGYLAIPVDKYENVIQSKFGRMDWNKPHEEDRVQRHHKPPFRALVKKLATSNQAVVNPTRMLIDLKVLRKNGIYTRDIHARNYRDGLLIDFSMALTAPHWMLWTLKGDLLRLKKDSELTSFDEMIESEQSLSNVTEQRLSRVRATRNVIYCRKLRSSTPIDEYYDVD